MRKVIVHEFLDTADVQQMIEGEIAGITKATIGLGDVDNTSDTDKPVSSAVQSALDTIETTPGTPGPTAKPWTRAFVVE